MQNYFLLGRWLWLIGFLLFSGSILLWMQRNKARALYGLSIFLWAIHGALYYTLYLLFYYHPHLAFNLQTFADWGSLIFGQGAWTGALIGLDLLTGWFSERFLGWLLPKLKRA